MNIIEHMFCFPFSAAPSVSATNISLSQGSKKIKNNVGIAHLLSRKKEYF
jgi:hypothetical protein